MMSHDDAFRKFEHPVAFVFSKTPLVTFSIALVVINQHVANVKQPSRPKHALSFSQERPLLFAIRNTGKHGKE